MARNKAISDYTHELNDVFEFTPNAENYDKMFIPKGVKEFLLLSGIHAMQRGKDRWMLFVDRGSDRFAQEYKLKRNQKDWQEAMSRLLGMIDNTETVWEKHRR